MTRKLVGMVALVTGSTSGMGRATAKLFAQEGARVVVTGRRRQLGEQAVEEIREEGGEATYFQADVGRSDEVRALVRFTLDTYGRLDVLMNNAYSGKGGSAVSMQEEDWDAHIAVSLKAYYLASHIAIPEMIKQGGGSIINTSSVHGVLAGPSHFFGSIAYATAKAGIINMTRQMAVDFGPQNIRVNAICPGRILTESKLEWLSRNPDIDEREKYFYPLRRFGETSDIAKAALFLASDDSSFITGHALLVDGGLTAQLPDSVGALIYDKYCRPEKS